MDANRFDAMLRDLANQGSRRVIVRLVASVALGGALGAGTIERALTKKKNKNKRSCPICRQREKGKCRPRPEGTPCTRDPRFQSERICRGGRCLCPALPSGSGIDLNQPCNEQNPEECETGRCGCNGDVCPCSCRRTDCVGPGQPCEFNSNCCQGVCSLALGSICST